MPNLWKFISKAEPDAPKVQAYQFSEAEELELSEEFEPFQPEEEDFSSLLRPGEESGADKAEESEETNPVQYAQLQSELLLQDAQRRAEEILRQAEEAARLEAEELRAKAREEGYQAGFHEGLQQGLAQAMEESGQAREAMAQKMQEDVALFLDKADRKLNRQLDDNLDELRDLALAVAEKVVCVSLKSSSDVIGRMIQTAVDKRRRREWAHIYVAECDAKKLVQMPAALMAALSELSDRVRIIPMAGEEAGTCIIECPDEIIDASASTQMQNIRDMLNGHSSSGIMTNFNFTQR